MPTTPDGTLVLVESRPRLFLLQETPVNNQPESVFLLQETPVNNQPPPRLVLDS